jgi:hypothetical protein
VRSFVVAAGTVFGLIAIAHFLRIAVEPHLVRDPWFILTTVVAVGLSVWAWALVRRSRRT